MIHLWKKRNSENNITTLNKNWKKEKKSLISSSLNGLFFSMKTIAAFNLWIFSPLLQSSIPYYTITTLLFVIFPHCFPKYLFQDCIIWYKSHELKASVSPSVVPNFRIFVLENVDGIWLIHFPCQTLLYFLIKLG